MISKMMWRNNKKAQDGHTRRLTKGLFSAHLYKVEQEKGIKYTAIVFLVDNVIYGYTGKDEAKVMSQAEKIIKSVLKVKPFELKWRTKDRDYPSAKLGKECYYVEPRYHRFYGNITGYKACDGSGEYTDVRDPTEGKRFIEMSLALRDQGFKFLDGSKFLTYDPYIEHMKCGLGKGWMGDKREIFTHELIIKTEKHDTFPLKAIIIADSKKWKGKYRLYMGSTFSDSSDYRKLVGEYKSLEEAKKVIENACEEEYDEMHEGTFNE